MSYQEFIQQIISILEKYVPIGTEIKVHKVMKNNNLQLDGLTIMKPGSNISPTFYLNYYYEDYMEHGDLDRIIQLILSVYEEHKDMVHVDPEFFTNFDCVKDNIVYRVVNFSMNRELLKDIPHIPYLDLAIVFYCLIRHEGFSNATILIRNHHLKFWNLTDEDLYNIAIKNTPKLLPYKLETMKELLEEFHSIHSPESPLSEDVTDMEAELCPPDMYILSNENKMFGAACILYLHLLDEISEKFQTSFYVLPSSIHEVILVPSTTNHLLEHYTEMVRCVNDTHVLNEDILSNHAYFYSKENRALMYY